MKKIITIFCFITIAGLISSCDDVFDPSTDFQQSYAVFFILDGDTTYQFATVSKSFTINGYDPATYNGDPYIENADVVIRSDDEEIHLRDTVSTNSEGEPFKIYYTNSYQPASNSLLQLDVTLPDGTLLTSNTETPSADNLNFRPFGIVTDYFVYEKPEGLTIFWSIEDANGEGNLYLPVLNINYYKNENGIQKKMKKEVPIHYFQSGDDFIPFDPVVIEQTQINYAMDVISRAMSEISEGDTNKYNYSIDNVVFDLFILDQNLAPYYLTTQTFLDGFTVLLNNFDYSNISGGFGVFGSFYKREIKISIDPEYISSFGYLDASDL